MPECTAYLLLKCNNEALQEQVRQLDASQGSAVVAHRAVEVLLMAAQDRQVEMEDEPLRIQDIRSVELKAAEACQVILEATNETLEESGAARQTLPTPRSGGAWW